MNIKDGMHVTEVLSKIIDTIESQVSALIRAETNFNALNQRVAELENAQKSGSKTRRTLQSDNQTPKKRKLPASKKDPKSRK